METYGTGRKITKSTMLLCALLACILLIMIFLPSGESKDKLSEILLAQPAFAQQTTFFPSDEAGISAYVNVGQGIDLAKAKSALRGIQAEGDNYVIGIMELPGLPEEEFPHMYISSDGWILAYYSKFAPASRIMHWGRYGGGTIETTTLREAIIVLDSVIGVSPSQNVANLGYYHFGHPSATHMTVAVDSTEAEDTFSYSIPSGVTLYEASYSHYSRAGSSGNDYSLLRYEDERSFSVTDQDAYYLNCDRLEDRYLLPEKAHAMTIRRYKSVWAGVAVVFIYR